MAEVKENDLRANVIEFVSRLSNIENEMSELRERKKDLVDEFSDKIDMKTMRLALQVIKAQNKVTHKFEFDQMIEVLENEATVP